MDAQVPHTEWCRTVHVVGPLNPHILNREHETQRCGRPTVYLLEKKILVSVGPGSLDHVVEEST